MLFGVPVGIFLSTGFGGSVASAAVPVLVRGVVVDAETLAPVADATLLPLHDPADARDPARGAAQGRTDATGAFALVVTVETSHTTDFLGRVHRRSRGNAKAAVRALLVEKEGYVALVHPTDGATWIERREEEIVGTLDVGTVRLSRAPR